MYPKGTPAPTPSPTVEVPATVPETRVDLCNDMTWRQSQLIGVATLFTRSAERCIALQERDWAERFRTTQLPEVAKARAEALEDATVATATAEAAYTSRCITHGHDSAEATAALAEPANSHLWAVTGVTPRLSELDPGRAWGRAGPVCSSSAN